MILLGAKPKKGDGLLSHHKIDQASLLFNHTLFYSQPIIMALRIARQFVVLGLALSNGCFSESLSKRDYFSSVSG